MLKSLVEFFYPSRCPLCRCEKVDDISRVCASCQGNVRTFAEPRCRLCGVTADTVSGICRECLKADRPWQRGSSVFMYEGDWRECIHSFKYKGQVWLLPYLAEELYQCWRRELSDWPVDYVVPVPLHWFKQWRRGYNQSFFLAQDLSRRIGVPVLDCLKRSYSGVSQTVLSRKARQQNITDVFSLTLGKSLRGRNVLLIDDVMTTGATLTGCCRCLNKSGVASIVVLTLSRG